MIYNQFAYLYLGVAAGRNSLSHPRLKLLYLNLIKVISKSKELNLTMIGRDIINESEKILFF